MSATLVLNSLSRRAALPCVGRFATAAATSIRQTAVLRTFVSRTSPLLDGDDNLPYHIVVGMPALSPTMESGALAEWYIKEGDSFIAGDSVAKIETDKATMDFEAQDDGYCAKILVEAGGPDEIPVGKPIMVTVEEEEDVGAFANFTPPEAADTAPPPPKEGEEKEKEAPPKAAESSSSPPPPPAPAPPAKEEAPAAAAAESTPPPPPPPPAATSPPPAQSAPAPAAPTSGWGSLAFQNSPIAKTLSKKQKAYVEMYGTTGQAPL